MKGDSIWFKEKLLGLERISERKKCFMFFNWIVCRTKYDDYFCRDKKKRQNRFWNVWRDCFRSSYIWSKKLSGRENVFFFNFTLLPIGSSLMLNHTEKYCMDHKWLLRNCGWTIKIKISISGINSMHWKFKQFISGFFYSSMTWYTGSPHELYYSKK